MYEVPLIVGFISNLIINLLINLTDIKMHEFVFNY